MRKLLFWAVVTAFLPINIVLFVLSVLAESITALNEGVQEIGHSFKSWAYNRERW